MQQTEVTYVLTYAVCLCHFAEEGAEHQINDHQHNRRPKDALHMSPMAVL